MINPIPADTNRDTQINTVYLYRFGGTLDQYYQVATQAVSGAGAITIQDTMADAYALTADLPLRSDVATPPNAVVGSAQTRT